MRFLKKMVVSRTAVANEENASAGAIMFRSGISSLPFVPSSLYAIHPLRSHGPVPVFTQEQAAEKIGITHSFYSAIEGKSGKFPPVEKLQDIGAAFGIPVYRLFVDRPDVDEMPNEEVLDRFVEFMVKQYRKDLLAAKAKFLKGLETEKRTGKNPFEGDEMFKE